MKIDHILNENDNKDEINEIVLKNMVNYIYQNHNSLSHYLCDDIIELFENEIKNNNTILDSKNNICSFIISKHNEKWIRIYNLLIQEIQINLKKHCSYIENKSNYNSVNNYGKDFFYIDNEHYISEIKIMKYTDYERDYINEYEFNVNIQNKDIKLYTFFKVMWFLNDVMDNYLEFWENMKIYTEKGKNIIFPISWEYDYKETKSIENKYIITTILYKKY